MVEPRRRRLDFARARSRSSCPLPRLTLPLVAAWPKISDAIAGEAPPRRSQCVRGAVRGLAKPAEPVFAVTKSVPPTSGGFVAAAPAAQAWRWASAVGVGDERHDADTV